MPEINLESLKKHRAITFNTQSGLRLASPEQAVEFVNQRGFVFFWPVKGWDCPSLWVAAAGDRPVPDEHDDPGHITWGWKDGMLGLRRWYYARCIARRNAMISLDILPHFYALSPNYGDPESDVQDEYIRGVMRLETKQVFDALLREGPLDTLALRKAARLASPESEGRFNRALDELQMGFRVLPVGISQAGAWRYAFVYDLVHRHYPNLIAQAHLISESDARLNILQTHLKNVGAVQEASLVRMFRWRTEDTRRSIDTLISAGIVKTGVTRSDLPGAWLCLSELCQ